MMSPFQADLSKQASSFDPVNLESVDSSIFPVRLDPRLPHKLSHVGYRVIDHRCRHFETIASPLYDACARGTASSSRGP